MVSSVQLLLLLCRRDWAAAGDTVRRRQEHARHLSGLRVAREISKNWW